MYNLSSYIKIARLDHWFKNIFMLPGMILSLIASPELLIWTLPVKLFLAFFSAGCIASSNYTLNEILDAPYDALHPVKCKRPVPSGQINIRLGYAQWIILAVLGLAISLSLGKIFFYNAFSLWVMGCIYNIPPVRSKDRPFIDVLSESINNPIRLLLGWYATGITTLPPVSILLAYWMIGSFFMAVKRFAEYRRINDPMVSANYRRSFHFYTEERLLMSILFYAVAFGLFFGIFLIRYRMEMILAVPFIAGFIAWYMHLGFLEDSPAQYPERLYLQKGFSLYCLFCSFLLLLLFFIDIPMLASIFHPTIHL